MVRLIRPSRIVGTFVVASLMLPAHAHAVVADSGSDTTTPGSSSTTDTAGSTTLPVTDSTSAAQTVTSIVESPVVPPVRPLPKVRIGSVVVVLQEQTAYVYSRSRRLIATIPVSTGLNDTTPTGSFRVFSKSAQAYYTPNPGERMRWMVRFTKGRGGDNIGFHGIPYRVTSSGEIPLRTPVGLAPSSHGCVRSREADAKWLFDHITISTPVRVVRTRGS